MCGTTRMGNDPKNSVVDQDCKAWDLDNLYITDASVFPSSSSVNPTLTIVANAMRVAEAIKIRLGALAAPLAPYPERAVGDVAPETQRRLAKSRKKMSLWPFVK